MEGQITIFDFLNSLKPFMPNNELSQDLCERGSSVVGGKKRIYEKYASNTSKSDRILFLKKEFGIGGRSHSFSDGSSGCINYSGKGIEVRKWNGESDTTTRFTWNQVDDLILDAVASGAFRA